MVQVQPALRGRIKNVQKMGRKKDSNRERVEAALHGQIETTLRNQVNELEKKLEERDGEAEQMESASMSKLNST